MAHATVRLSGEFSRLDSTPESGAFTIRASRRPLTDQDGHVILTGSISGKLDVAGAFQVDIPASDDPSLGESFTYSVSVSLSQSSWSFSEIHLPASEGAVDLSDLPEGHAVQYVTRAVLDAVLAGYEPVTISTTPPDSGLWVNPTEEA